MSGTDIYGYDLTEETTGKVLKVRYGEAVNLPPPPDPEGVTTVATRVLADPGSYQIPSISFTANQDTGLYNTTDGFGVTVNSSQVVEFRSGGVELQVPILGAPVQTNPLDFTPGKFMTPGAFGLGGTAPALSGIPNGGTYTYSRALGHTGLPASVVEAVIFQGTMEGTSDSTAQVAVPVRVDTGSPIAVGLPMARARRDGVWSDWRYDAPPPAPPPARTMIRDVVNNVRRICVRDPITGMQEIWMSNVPVNPMDPDLQAWMRPFSEAPTVVATAGSGNATTPRTATLTQVGATTFSVLYHTGSTSTAGFVHVHAFGPYTP